MSDEVADHGDLAARRRAAPTPGEPAARARATVVAALESCDAALAAWEAGSAAFGRADERSDLDVGVLCAPDGAPVVLDAIEHALCALEGSDIDAWDVGRSLFGIQRFWRPAESAAHASWCLVDVSVMQQEAERDLWGELLMPERHGRALPLHDPHGLLERSMAETRFDAAAHRERIRTELARIRDRHAMFRDFASKELERSRPLDAHSMYQAMVVTPLVMLLGMVHRPLRFDFAQRYLHDELPATVVDRLGWIARPALDQLPAAIDAGRAWIDELLGTIDVDELPIEQHATQMRAAFG